MYDLVNLISCNIKQARSIPPFPFVILRQTKPYRILISFWSERHSYLIPLTISVERKRTSHSPFPDPLP